MAWVGQSADHAVAFACAERAWKDAERLKALGPDADDRHALAELSDGPRGEPASDGHASPVWSKRHAARAAMAASLALALVLAAGAIPLPWAADASGGPETARETARETYETQRAEVRDIRLADGSIMHLNSASQVQLGFSEKRRLVRLLRGEASFDVASGETRPFDVIAGGTTVRALGTHFTVHSRADAVEVMVSEGAVTLRGGGKVGGNVRQLAAGHGAVVTASGYRAMPLDSRAIRQRRSWESRVLVFDGMTVGAAVRQFNRYREAPIVVTDPDLAGRPAAGRFGLRESDRFIDALESGLGAVVSRRDDGIVEVSGS